MAKKILSKSQTDLNINKLIKSFFKDKHNVLLVFLFGSYASKQMTTSSDIDIGVLFDEMPSIKEFWFFRDSKTITVCFMEIQLINMWT